MELLLNDILFNGWDTVLRTLIIGVLAYIALVILLRVSGKRTLSKMNAFDWVVTVALGSTLASALLNSNVALVEAVVAFALLIGLQFLVTWSSVRAPWVRRLVTGEPQMLAYRGELLPDSMRAARVTEDEVRTALRDSGLAGLSAAEAVVLETDGSLTVVPASADTDARDGSLRDVTRLPAREGAKSGGNWQRRG
jgi:uncharacterized membrane protein YcaP (DUF421 family)